MIACVCISMAPIVGSLTEYFLPCAILFFFFFQVKARRPCTVDGGIVIRDCGACIR